MHLTVNYRSHERIIAAYNRFMGACDWSNPQAPFDFRYAKEIEPNLDEEHPDYPAVFSIWGADRRDEANDARHFLQDLTDILRFVKSLIPSSC